MPTRRAILISLALVAAGAALYVVARESPVFAIRRVRVEGAPPGIAREVAAVAAADRGRSLLRLDGGALVHKLRALPDVAAVRYDRAFPHTLRLVVTPERPVAVLRQGNVSWVVSMRGRIIRRLPLHTRRGLPRIWVPGRVHLGVGAIVHDRLTLHAVAALDPLLRDPLGTPIANVAVDGGEVTLVTASHIEIQLGDPTDLALKLAIVRRVLPGITPSGSGVAYLDVSVPERTVSGVRTLNPKVEVKASSSGDAGIAH